MEADAKTPAKISWYDILRDRYRAAWADREFRLALPVSIVLFVVAVVVNTIAGLYATERASNAVTDIILSNVPPFDVGALFIYGSMAFTVFVIGLLLLNPSRIPFTLCALALFWIIRAVFISVTHIGPYPDHTPLDFQSTFLLDLYGAGQFFSGHAGSTFLFALMFWGQKRLRYFFLAWCGLFVAIVWLGHLHYTIDVLSAFFITYTIYQIALHIFPKEYALFAREDAAPPIPPERSLVSLGTGADANS